MVMGSTIRSVIVANVIGMVYFGAIMGVAIGLVNVNAQVSPNFAWFPVTNTIIVVIGAWLAQKYWKIGFEPAGDVPWVKVYIVGVCLTALGIATALVQGKFTGYTRATELLELEVSGGFAVTYAIYMSVFAAVLAEITFRGVIQARMEKVLSVWPVVIIIGIINVLAHRWGPEITLNWLGLFVTLAGWTYLRWLSRSLWPPLILHTLTNLLVALGLWNAGPLVHADVKMSSIIGIAGVGLVSLVISVVVVRSMQSSAQTS